MTGHTAAGTDVGRTRDHNEDDYLVTTYGDRTLLAVADGMGGHRAGDVASETALDAFENALAGRLGGSSDDLAASLRGAVEAANDRVRERARAEGREGMGTTLVAALVHDDEATVVNVGDSRAYHVDGSAIDRITVDQSLVQSLVDEGVVDPDEAADHPQRHVLSQALGTNDDVDPDVYERPVTGTLLLCSDGLTEEVPEPSIREVVVDDSPDDAVDRLVDAANDNGGSDNVTVVLHRP
ncbi:Stp1/IreP family PP2C-type Ser/Thr phosphatase [Haloplanus rallus]|jgi:serine/threonine protein phosphatase PrpC|uniref:Stp1/IreP family PP2C-type Ser/Thr phosphatase n=1 Tax=Haloplanus rallus TaxID=1816183 RepID=A0A6B9F1P2_9EURY|nr:MULTISPECIES: Stp1/IreP family PP2C-type Ser/Thr phosphatase [Haloplanus]QGX94078.1 Stp1/IreP family PP2C-type Ser/Thr phosphatase [Haloplanus rallus]